MTDTQATPSETSDKKPLVSVTDLCKVFPVADRHKVHAVEHVSLELGRGETLAVVGESGCGKSTLAHLIIRLLDPTAGQIVVDGTEITNLSARAMRAHRQKMQIIFQDPFASLDPRRSVGKAVAEPLRVHKLSSGDELEERVGDLFERVGLERSHTSQFPHQFSGGQRQRICIARALALQPQLVIADEAVSALDVSIQAQVINLMMDLQDEMGLSYLFISHDLAVVERISHRVAVMYLGQIVELGPRSAIFENPQHSYTKRLLDAVPIADPRKRRERPLLTSEIPSPRWGPGESPERVELVEVEPGHFVGVE
jgi:glutathione transport system ATP-binding protein